MIANIDGEQIATTPATAREFFPGLYVHAGADFDADGNLIPEPGLTPARACPGRLIPQQRVVVMIDSHWWMAEVVARTERGALCRLTYSGHAFDVDLIDIDIDDRDHSDDGAHVRLMLEAGRLLDRLQAGTVTLAEVNAHRGAPADADPTDKVGSWWHRLGTRNWHIVLA